MKYKLFVLSFALLYLVFSLSACSHKDSLLNPKDPVTLTMWHVYGSQTNSPMNDMVYRFNQTVGRENGVILTVTSVSNSSDIEEALRNSAENVPGSADLPDLFTAYPNTLLQIDRPALWLDFREYFTEEELSCYVQPFLEEGFLEGKLQVFPLAKSTELLFVNRTLYDRFASETGYTAEDLQNISCLWETCQAYYEWTDQMTPDIPNDGSSLFMYNDPLHYFSMGLSGRGEDAFIGERLNFDAPGWRDLWMPYAVASIQGGVSLIGGYASDPMKTGELISAVGSSAGILYYSDTVTYEDNTSEDVVIQVYPCPYEDKNTKLAYQRGVGLCALNSEDERKNQAAALFAKWITDSENNTSFCTKSGYLPVKTEAYKTLLEVSWKALDSEKYRQLYEAAGAIYEDYRFYTPPQFTGYSLLEKKFADTVQMLLTNARNEYLNCNTGADSSALAAELAEKAFEELKLSMSADLK